MAEAEDVLKHWAPELSFPDDISKVPTPTFNYRIEGGSLDTARNLDCTDNVKDTYIQELMTAYEELEDLYKKERAKNAQRTSLVEISNLHTES